MCSVFYYVLRTVSKNGLKNSYEMASSYYSLKPNITFFIVLKFLKFYLYEHLVAWYRTMFCIIDTFRKVMKSNEKWFNTYFVKLVEHLFFI